MPNKDYPFQTIVTAMKNVSIKPTPAKPSKPSVLAMAAGMGILIFALEFVVMLCIKGCAVTP